MSKSGNPVQTSCFPHFSQAKMNACEAQKPNLVFAPVFCLLLLIALCPYAVCFVLCLSGTRAGSGSWRTPSFIFQSYTWNTHRSARAQRPRFCSRPASVKRGHAAISCGYPGARKAASAQSNTRVQAKRKGTIRSIRRTARLVMQFASVATA